MELVPQKALQAGYINKLKKDLCDMYKNTFVFMKVKPIMDY